MSRHRKSHSNTIEQDNGFLEDLQEILLEAHDDYGINAFQTVFNRKKMINQMIAREKKLKEDAHLSYLRAQQRVVQIEQLQTKVDRQTALLKSQVQKINDAHNMSKLLMMEKILKLQRETEEIERKRNLCYEIRADKEKSTLSTLNRNMHRVQNYRLGNLSRTEAVRQELENSQYQTIQSNRRKAESVRLDRDRRSSRLKRIEEFKKERASKNYKQKVEGLQKTIELKEAELGKLALKQEEKQHHLHAAENVSEQYMTDFFATSTL